MTEHPYNAMNRAVADVANAALAEQGMNFALRAAVGEAFAQLAAANRGEEVTAAAIVNVLVCRGDLLPLPERYA